MEMRGGKQDWQPIEHRLAVVKLSVAVRLLIPAVLISTIPLRVRGASFEGGKTGVVLGGLLVAGAALVSVVLFPLAGVAGIVLAVWLIGSTGLIMVANWLRPIAFVKPICVRCRLIPVIREHEAIHISGVESDREVWDSMKTRHSCESLRLNRDPAICSFCPIPRRLKES